jgi:hypothetical protein
LIPSAQLLFTLIGIGEPWISRRSLIPESKALKFQGKSWHVRSTAHFAALGYISFPAVDLGWQIFRFSGARRHNLKRETCWSLTHRGEASSASVLRCSRRGKPHRIGLIVSNQPPPFSKRHVVFFGAASPGMKICLHLPSDRQRVIVKGTIELQSAQPIRPIRDLQGDGRNRLSVDYAYEGEASHDRG